MNYTGEKYDSYVTNSVSKNKCLSSVYGCSNDVALSWILFQDSTACKTEKQVQILEWTLASSSDMPGVASSWQTI